MQYANNFGVGWEVVAGSPLSGPIESLSLHAPHHFHPTCQKFESPKLKKKALVCTCRSLYSQLPQYEIKSMACQCMIPSHVFCKYPLHLCHELCVATSRAQTPPSHMRKGSGDTNPDSWASYRLNLE